MSTRSEIQKLVRENRFDAALDLARQTGTSAQQVARWTGKPLSSVQAFVRDRGGPALTGGAGLPPSIANMSPQKQVRELVRTNDYDTALDIARQNNMSAQQVAALTGKPLSAIQSFIADRSGGDRGTGLLGGGNPQTPPTRQAPTTPTYRGSERHAARDQRIADAYNQGDFNRAYQIATRHQLGADTLANILGRTPQEVRQWASDQGYRNPDANMLTPTAVRNEYAYGTPQPVFDPMDPAVNEHLVIEPAGARMSRNTMWRAQPGTNRYNAGHMFTQLGDSMGDTARHLVGGSLVAPYDPISGAYDVNAPKPNYGEWIAPEEGQAPGHAIPFGQYWSGHMSPMRGGGAIAGPADFVGPRSTAWRPTHGGGRHYLAPPHQPGTRLPTGAAGGPEQPPPLHGAPHIPNQQQPPTGSYTATKTPQPFSGLPNGYGSPPSGFGGGMPSYGGSPWSSMGLPFNPTPLYGMGNPYAHMMNPWMSGFQSPMNQWSGGGMNPYGGMGGNPYQSSMPQFGGMQQPMQVGMPGGAGFGTNFRMGGNDMYGQPQQPQPMQMWDNRMPERPNIQADLTIRDDGTWWGGGNTIPLHGPPGGAGFDFLIQQTQPSMGIPPGGIPPGNGNIYGQMPIPQQPSMPDYVRNWTKGEIDPNKATRYRIGDNRLPG